MATQQEIDRTLTALEILKTFNNLNVADIENHREDFKDFLVGLCPVISTFWDNNSTTFDEFLFAARQTANGIPRHLIQWLPDTAPVPNDAFER